MLPLSFKEFVEGTGNSDNLSQKYREYLETSSFPYAINLKEQPKEIKSYLEGLYNTIVVKDISSRRKISDTMMLESVVRFVFDNIDITPDMLYVFADVYYKGDLDYEKRPYGTLCLYDDESEWVTYKLSRAERKMLERREDE